jgi:flavorubredoxin
MVGQEPLTKEVRMPGIQIKPGIYWIGVNDRTTDLFEGLWPITQEGVSYNSYLVLDEKKALVDLAKDHQGSAFLEQMHDLVDPRQLDYIVINHMEPDHTGLVRVLRQLAPQATFVGTDKAVAMLESFYGLTENVMAVEDGQELSLGQKTLRFIKAPFVHWPETMVTYVPEDQVVFSCDAFGGYGALQGALFDDECQHMDFYIQESLRYYVNIVARFSGPVRKAIGKLAGVPIQVIAPSHGLVWRQHPERIVALYDQWARYATEPAEPGITLLYGSMYGNTETMMNAVAEGISRTGLPLQIFDVARTHASYILPSLWTHQGVVVGAPTYEVSLFPPMEQVLQMAVHKRISGRQAAYFGSYGWSGGARKGCEAVTEPLKWEWRDALEFVGAPTSAELRQGQEFGYRFALGLASESA